MFVDQCDVESGVIVLIQEFQNEGEFENVKTRRICEIECFPLLRTNL